MTDILLKFKDRQRAVDYSRRVLSRVKGPNYTNLEMEDRFFVGRCGEIAVRKWAENLGLVFTETVNDRGVPDKQDFLFRYRDGRVCRANVKNTHHPRGKYLMQPVAQAEKHQQDIYIGASGLDDGSEVVVRLWGAINHTDFMCDSERVLRKIPTLQLPLQALPISMSELAKRIDTHEVAVVV